MRAGVAVKQRRQPARQTRPASGIRLITIAIPAGVRNAAMAIIGMRRKIAVCRIARRKLARPVRGGILTLKPAKLIAVRNQRRHHAKYLQGALGTRLISTALGARRRQPARPVITITPNQVVSA